MLEDGDRWSRGLAAYASQLRLPKEKVFEHLRASFGERMATEAISAAGGAWKEDCLSLRDRSLAVVAALVAQGDSEARLRPHTRWALAHGATAEELEALVALLAVYVGYPRASVAMEVVRDVLGEEQGTD
ncbi:MAG: carboxymuconolactone decarboxylase family protein [Gaiellaceae bacterium]